MAQKKILLLLDYDGTLTPIVKHPARAKISPLIKKTLADLAARPEVRVAVVSGRELADLRKMVGLAVLIYIGNHGFESWLNKKTYLHPAAAAHRPLMKKIFAHLRQTFQTPGLLLEDKGATLTLHYRQLAAKELKGFLGSFNKAVRPWRRQVRVTRGKKVIEIRPLFDWHKGKAIVWLMRKLKLTEYWPVYIGDDRTDEDAFLAIKGRGLGIFVGKGKTMADRRLPGTMAVGSLLQNILKKLESGMKSGEIIESISQAGKPARRS